MSERMAGEQSKTNLSSRFVKVELRAGVENLPDSERRVVTELVKAARYLDEIYDLQQGSAVGQIAKEMREHSDKFTHDEREYFRIMHGPWDRVKADAPFIGDTPRPLGAGYYPEDISKEEFEAWVQAHPEHAESMRSPFTIIERHGDKLVAVPYSKAFREPLAKSAEHLRGAAEITDNESLRNFLRMRAEAFETNEYRDSDMAWMDINGTIEPTVGPYETYDDNLLGYKASYEAYISLVRHDDSIELENYKQRLPWLEMNLPIPDEYKHKDRGTDSPIKVVDLVLGAGEGNVSVKAAAYNLPNDEIVQMAKGSKNVLMHNVMKAKFDTFLAPIATHVLAPEDAAKVSFEAYFQEVLHHELSHGLGPSAITIDGRATEVRTELKELYSSFEETKADVMGVYNILALIEQGDMPASLRESLDATYVAGLFRMMRFGVHKAHAKGAAAQLNFLLEQGALELDTSGRYRTSPENFPDGIKNLLQVILTLQATGDYDGTKQFLETYGVATPAIDAAVERLQYLPIDLDLKYVDAERLLNE